MFFPHSFAPVIQLKWELQSLPGSHLCRGEVIRLPVPWDFPRRSEKEDGVHERGDCHRELGLNVGGELVAPGASCSCCGNPAQAATMVLHVSSRRKGTVSGKWKDQFTEVSGTSGSEPPSWDMLSVSVTAATPLSVTAHILIDSTVYKDAMALRTSRASTAFCGSPSRPPQGGAKKIQSSPVRWIAKAWAAQPCKPCTAMQRLQSEKKVGPRSFNNGAQATTLSLLPTTEALAWEKCWELIFPLFSQKKRYCSGYPKVTWTGMSVTDSQLCSMKARNLE